MGREVRKVPKAWDHPKEDGQYRGLFDGDCTNAQAKWDAGLALWTQGKRDDYKGGTEDHEERADIFGWVEWAGDRPSLADYMPNWPQAERTHFMMYETTSEGTPISPAFETPEALAKWLAKTGASSFGDMTATYEQWLAVARGGYAPSAVYEPGKGLRSGVEAMADKP